jgi:hypothetical protein
MVLFLAGAKNFLISTTSKPDVGLTEAPVQRILRPVSPGGKRLQHKYDSLSPPSAMAGDDGSHASTSTLLTQTIQLLVINLLAPEFYI